MLYNWGQLLLLRNTEYLYHLVCFKYFWPFSILYVYLFIVEDWDLFEKMMDHLYDKHIKSEAELHPVLFSEVPVSTIK